MRWRLMAKVFLHCGVIDMTQLFLPYIEMLVALAKYMLPEVEYSRMMYVLEV
jgi:hypothetical protein